MCVCVCVCVRVRARVCVISLAKGITVRKTKFYLFAALFIRLERSKLLACLVISNYQLPATRDQLQSQTVFHKHRLSVAVQAGFTDHRPSVRSSRNHCFLLANIRLYHKCLNHEPMVHIETSQKDAR